MPAPDDDDRLTDSEPLPERLSRGRSWVFWGGVVAAVALMLMARPTVAWWARHRAETHLRAGRVSHAHRWLSRAARIDANGTPTQLLIARGYRHSDQRLQWEETIEQIDAAAVGSQPVRNEKRLGALQWGEVATIRDNEWERLINAGVDRDDAAIAVAHGLVLAGADQPFERLLKEWEETSRHPQQIAFLRGIFWKSKQNQVRAESYLRKTLELEPEHLMAHATLAQMMEHQGEFTAALEHFARWAQHQSSDDRAVTGWSRNLRQLGHADQAKRVMQQLAPSTDASVPVALEWAQVEYSLGNYSEATRWFKLADLDGPHYSSVLRTAATAFALRGDAMTAETIFDRVIDVQNRQRRIEELQKRVINDPRDRKAAEALQKVTQPAEEVAPTTSEAASHPVSPLFSEHCASCHGSRGEADGPASRHLFPPARNLRADSYRLITNTNRQPSRQDIEAVIRDGIPGTAMPSFAELSAEERAELVEQVYQLRKEGMRDQLAERHRAIDQAADEELIEEIIRQRFAAANPLDIPQPEELSSPSRVAAGRQLYEQAGCVQCHGADGRGAFDVPLFNDDGSHALPRDLVSEPWKGGESPEALFARLRLGMPGTPHPENSTLDDEQTMSLVAYCLSISSDSKVARTNRQRAILANERAIQSRFGADK